MFLIEKHYSTIQARLSSYNMRLFALAFVLLTLALGGLGYAQGLSSETLSYQVIQPFGSASQELPSRTLSSHTLTSQDFSSQDLTYQDFSSRALASTNNARTEWRTPPSIVSDAQPQAVMQPLSMLDRNLISTIGLTSTDTSGTMQKLNSVNNFMEWYMLYFPVPFGSYSKETSWLFGLTKYNAFTMRRKGEEDSNTQASSITAFGYYTLNTQYKAVLESNLMFPNNRAIWKSTLAYIYYPLLYYGVGNNTRLNQERTLNTLNIQFSTSYLFKVWKKLYVGPAYDYFNYFKVEIDGSKPCCALQSSHSRRASPSYVPLPLNRSHAPRLRDSSPR